MQSLRTSRNLAARLPRRTPVTARRTYAEVNQRGPGGEPSANAGGDPKNTTNVPLIAAVGVVAFIPIYYFSQARSGGAREGDSPAGEGQASIKESRRQNGTQGEYRDPRDSGKKTSKQDEIRKEAAAKQQ